MGPHHSCAEVFRRYRCLLRTVRWGQSAIGRPARPLRRLVRDTEARPFKGSLRNTRSRKLGEPDILIRVLLLLLLPLPVLRHRVTRVPLSIGRLVHFRLVRLLRVVVSVLVHDGGV